MWGAVSETMEVLPTTKMLQTANTKGMQKYEAVVYKEKGWASPTSPHLQIHNKKTKVLFT